MGFDAALGSSSSPRFLPRLLHLHFWAANVLQVKKCLVGKVAAFSTQEIFVVMEGGVVHEIVNLPPNLNRRPARCSRKCTMITTSSAASNGRS